VFTLFSSPGLSAGEGSRAIALLFFLRFSARSFNEEGDASSAVQAMSACAFDYIKVIVFVQGILKVDFVFTTEARESRRAFASSVHIFSACTMVGATIESVGPTQRNIRDVSQQQ
jgi:hypothetical protein